MSFRFPFRTLLCGALFGLSTLLSPTSVQAAPVTIKLGTLAPVGSSYHKILLSMGDAWKKESKGGVELKLYAGGKAGGEAEMVGLMMENGMQAALLTAVGLAEIDPAARGLQTIPMGFNSLEEVDFVGERLYGTLEEIMAAKGFTVLFWMDVGWVRFFTNKRVETPEEMFKLRLFSWAGENAQMEIVKAAGFNVVPLETADIVPSLQTGLIDAVPLPPFFALAGQIDKRAPYMLDLNYAPLVGACVVSKKTWEKIPEEQRASLLAIARTHGRDMKAAGRRESGESEAAMIKRGLNVVHCSPAAVEAWRKLCQAQYPKVRTQMMPPAVFDKVMEAIRDYRAKETK